MKRHKNFITLWLSTIMLMSVMSIGVFANDTQYPYTYVDEESGTKVTIFDPNITVELTSNSADPYTAPYTAMNQKIGWVPLASPTRHGNSAPMFITDNNKNWIDFTMVVFPYLYNVGLCKCEGLSQSDSDPVLMVLEDRKAGDKATVRGLENHQKYYFRLSSWYGDGNCTYQATND